MPQAVVYVLLRHLNITGFIVTSFIVTSFIVTCFIVTCFIDPLLLVLLDTRHSFVGIDMKRHGNQPQTCPHCPRHVHKAL